MPLRILTSVLIVWMAFAVSCGGGEDGDSDGGESGSPRQRCLDAETVIDEAARQCDPHFGSVNLSCELYGTGSSCAVIDDYFVCLTQITCESGSVVFPSGCALGVCD